MCTPSLSAAQDAAVLVHGLTDHRDGFVLPQLAGALAGAGVGSLRLDMRGNGDSEGEFEFANMRDEARPCDAAPACQGKAGHHFVQPSCCLACARPCLLVRAGRAAACAACSRVCRRADV